MNYLIILLWRGDAHIFKELTTGGLIVEKVLRQIQRLVKQERWFVILLHYNSFAWPDQENIRFAFTIGANRWINEIDNDNYYKAKRSLELCPQVTRFWKTLCFLLFLGEANGMVRLQDLLELKAMMQKDTA